MKSKVVAIIPARFNSTRLPGKPLLPIHGKAMIEWVYERVSNCRLLTEVYVATDNEQIYEKVISFGGKVVITSQQHQSGTDRIAEAINLIDVDFDIVVNVQGDEPMIKSQMIDDVIQPFLNESIDISTLKKQILTQDELQNPNVVKVLTDKNGFAMYFSRYPIPFNRERMQEIKYFKHIGIYAYKADFLAKYAKLNVTPCEQSEKLEQLRVLENGYKIKVVETFHETIGVDLLEDITSVEKAMLKEGLI